MVHTSPRTAPSINHPCRTPLVKADFLVAFSPMEDTLSTGDLCFRLGSAPSVECATKAADAREKRKAMCTVLQESFETFYHACSHKPRVGVRQNDVRLLAGGPERRRTPQSPTCLPVPSFFLCCFFLLETWSGAPGSGDVRPLGFSKWAASCRARIYPVVWSAVAGCVSRPMAVFAASSLPLTCSPAGIQVT